MDRKEIKFAKRLDGITHFLIFTTLGLFNGSCGNNVLKDFSQSQLSSSSLYEEIVKKMDAQNYEGVVTFIQAQSASFQAEARAKEYLGQAYLGKCGISFIDFANNFSAASGDYSQIFRQFAYTFKNDTLVTADCGSARAVLLTTESPNKNLLLMITGIALMGGELKNNLDSNGDTTLDGDPCSNTDLSDTELNEVIAGFGLVLTYGTSWIADILGAGAATDISNIETLCNAIPDLAGKCNLTDPNSASIDANMRTAYRMLLDTSGQGFGSCDTSEAVPEDGDGQSICCLRPRESTP